MSESNERIHPATPYQRQVARREGRVARSRDLTAGAMVLVSLLTLLYFGNDLAIELGRFTTDTLSTTAGYSLDIDAAVEQWRTIAIRIAQPLLPMLAAGLLVAIATSVGQVGFLMLPDRVLPNWERVSPMRGIGRLCSFDNMVMLFWGLLKIGVVATVAAASVWNSRDTILSLSFLTTAAATATLTGMILWTGMKIAVAMLALGIVDYGFQWWRREQELMMTPEQMRHEMRGQQTNAAISSQRRQRMHGQLADRS